MDDLGPINKQHRTRQRRIQPKTGIQAKKAASSKKAEGELKLEERSAAKGPPPEAKVRHLKLKSDISLLGLKKFIFTFTAMVGIKKGRLVEINQEMTTLRADRILDRLLSDNRDLAPSDSRYIEKNLDSIISELGKLSNQDLMLLANELDTFNFNIFSKKKNLNVKKEVKEGLLENIKTELKARQGDSQERLEFTAKGVLDNIFKDIDIGGYATTEDLEGCFLLKEAMDKFNAAGGAFIDGNLELPWARPSREDQIETMKDTLVANMKKLDDGQIETLATMTSGFDPSEQPPREFRMKDPGLQMIKEAAQEIEQERAAGEDDDTGLL